MGSTCTPCFADDPPLLPYCDDEVRMHWHCVCNQHALTKELNVVISTQSSHRVQWDSHHVAARGIRCLEKDHCNQQYHTAVLEGRSSSLQLSQAEGEIELTLTSTIMKVM